MKISHLLVAVCCGFVGSISYVQADSSASELLHTIAAEAPGKEHTLNELAIALDELLGLERHVTENKHAAKNNIRRLEGTSTITSVVTRIVQILTQFKERIDSKPNTDAINQLQADLDRKATLPVEADSSIYTLPLNFDVFAKQEDLDITNNNLETKATIPTEAKTDYTLPVNFDFLKTTDGNSFALKTDLTNGLALKADKPGGNDSFVLQTEITKFATVSQLTNGLADKADQADLDDLNTTLQTFHDVIHDPVTLQDLITLQNALNSDETTNAAASTDQSNEDAAVTDDTPTSEPFTLPALRDGFTGYDEISCPVDASISSGFDVEMPPLNQLIGIDHTCANENNVSACISLEHVMYICMPLPEDAVCPSDCTVTFSGENVGCAPTPNLNGHVTSSCDACTLTPDSTGAGMVCALKQMPYTSEELACFDTTPVCTYFLTLYGGGQGPPPSDDGYGGSPSGDGGVDTSAWPLLSEYDNLDNCTGWTKDSSDAYEMIKYNDVVDENNCIPCDGVTAWLPVCMDMDKEKNNRLTTCHDYNAVCAAVDAMPAQE